LVSTYDGFGTQFTQTAKLQLAVLSSNGEHGKMFMKISQTVSEPAITVSGGFILCDRPNQQYKNNQGIIKRLQKRHDLRTRSVNSPWTKIRKPSIRYAIEYRDKPISRLWKLL
jgi:hypothetical protein